MFYSDKLVPPELWEDVLELRRLNRKEFFSLLPEPAAWPCPSSPEIQCAHFRPNRQPFEGAFFLVRRRVEPDCRRCARGRHTCAALDCTAAVVAVLHSSPGRRAFAA